MTNYAAHLQATRSISRPATSRRTPVRRLMIVATAIVFEGIVILAVVLSTVGAGSTPVGPGSRMPAPAAWTR